MNAPGSQVKRFIMAGTYAQYRKWLVDNGVNPAAAMYVRDERDLKGFRPGEVVVVLTGDYVRNPAYRSYQHLLLRGAA